MKFEDLLIISVVAVVAIIISSVIISGVIMASTKTACLEKGWRDYNVTWNYKRYCINRTDQTDIVKPLNEIN